MRAQVRENNTVHTRSNFQEAFLSFPLCHPPFNRLIVKILVVFINRQWIVLLPNESFVVVVVVKEKLIIELLVLLLLLLLLKESLF